jgi:L-2-hydroxycarboxylate dehydrogenase (NAD+)
MVKAAITDIRESLERALMNRGFASNEASVVAREYLDGELEGRTSHGLVSFPGLLNRLRGEKEPVTIIKQTNSLIYLDGNQNIGAWVGSLAVDRAVEMAEREGAALALIKNMINWLRPGSIARAVADRGFIGLVFNNSGSPLVAPPGGYDPMIGTNPIGIGLPTSGDPIVVDMAISTRAWGAAREASRKGEDLPENAFFDRDGNMAVSPREAYSALPFGDYKGFALGLLVEIIAGSLLGVLMGPEQRNSDGSSPTMGGGILVIDPRATTDLDAFRTANTRLLQEIKDSRKLEGVREILIPGERSAEAKRLNLENGFLEIDEKLWDDIQELSMKK